MSYLHPQKSTPDEGITKAILDRLRNPVGGKRYVEGEYKEKITDKLDAHFGFEATPYMPYGTPAEGQRQSVFRILRSPRYPDVFMIGFTDERRSAQNIREGGQAIDRHRVVFIKRPEGLEYYNPNGEEFFLFPVDLALRVEEGTGLDLSTLIPREDYDKPSVINVNGEEELVLESFKKTTKLTPALSFIRDHQGDYPVCANACVMRALHSQSRNEEVHRGFTNQVGAGVGSAERIVSASMNTVNKGIELKKAEPPNPANLKKGGIVKGMKGQAVPIVAHAGELVVPAEVVPKVLKSSAWIDHIKSVQKAQGISYKEAMKVAKGTYKK